VIGGMKMRFTDKNSILEFGMIDECIRSTNNRGEITDDDAETLTFFLQLVKEALLTHGRVNS